MDKQQEFRLLQQMEDRREALRLLVEDMKRRGELESMIAPFQEDITRINKSLLEFQRVLS